MNPRIQTFYNRLAAGDPVARHAYRVSLGRANMGDPRASVVIGALHSIHHNRVALQNQIKANDLYDKLARRDHVAQKTLASVLSGVRQGRPSAVRAFKLLQDVHLQRKAGSWKGAGSPRTGYHPMPYYNRAGVVFGAESPAQALTPQALIELLAIAQRIISSARIQQERFVAPPPDLPYKAPAPSVVTTTKLPTALVTQQNPMLQGTTMRKSSWMIAQ